MRKGLAAAVGVWLFFAGYAFAQGTHQFCQELSAQVKAQSGECKKIRDDMRRADAFARSEARPANERSRAREEGSQLSRQLDQCADKEQEIVRVFEECVDTYSQAKREGKVGPWEAEWSTKKLIRSLR